MGDVSGMIRPFLPAGYVRETAGHDLRKVVWVMATMDPTGPTELSAAPSAPEQRRQALAVPIR
jgi:hypothetical protein